MCACNNYDLIVIGGGPLGLSTAFHGARRGLKTLVLEQFSFFNNLGSSAGNSRQFRLQYAQQYMAELSIASLTFWAQLQSYTQDTLVARNGSLWFGDPSLSSQEGGINDAKAVMDTLNIPYTKMDAGDIEKQFGFKNLPPKYSGFFQADGGIINLKAAEQALFNAGLNTGLVDFHEWEGVTGIDSVEGEDITVTTDKDQYKGTKLAITTGPYINSTMALLGLSVPIDIWQMSSAYFKKTDSELQLPTWFAFQKPQDTALFYGFPEVDWSFPGYLRVATDFPDNGIILDSPDQRALAPSPKSLELDSKWVRDHMTGLDPTPRFTTTCLIALSKDPNKELLLDYVPESIPNHQNIVVMTAGWAAKFVPIVGDMICDMFESEQPDFTYGNYQIARSNFAIDWEHQ